MEFILILSILSLAVALPSQERPPPRLNCIKMTPEKEQQIDLIVEKLGHLINNLTIEHEQFDIRLINLFIEQHRDDEGDKETVLKLSVNDCQMSDDELDKIDHHIEMAIQREKDREAEKEKEVKKEKDAKEAALKEAQEADQKIAALETQIESLKAELENIKKSNARKEQDKPPVNDQKKEELNNDDEDVKQKHHECDETLESNVQEGKLKNNAKDDNAEVNGREETLNEREVKQEYQERDDNPESNVQKDKLNDNAKKEDNPEANDREEILNKEEIEQEHQKCDENPQSNVQEGNLKNNATDDNPEANGREETLNKEKIEQEHQKCDENPKSNVQEGLEEILNEEGKEVNPELMYLDLDDNGQKLVEALGRKKEAPIVVYVQRRNSGQIEHWFLKRR